MSNRIKPCGLVTGSTACRKCGLSSPHNPHRGSAIYRMFAQANLPVAQEGDDRFDFAGARQIERGEALLGWRFWAVAEAADGSGPRLLAPYRPDPTLPAAVWTSGDNLASSRHCWAAKCRSRQRHPSPACYCGIRAMTSLASLMAFHSNQEPRVGPLVALAQVELWGQVVGAADGDDWARTVRAERARIRDVLYLSDDVNATGLAEHYGVEVRSIDELLDR